MKSLYCYWKLYFWQKMVRQWRMAHGWFAFSWRCWSNLLICLCLVSLSWSLVSSRLDTLHHERRCTGMPEPNAMSHQHCDQLANRWQSLDATFACHRWCTSHGMGCPTLHRELRTHERFSATCRPTEGCSIRPNRLACVVFESKPNGWSDCLSSSQWARNQFCGTLRHAPKMQWFPLDKRMCWKQRKEKKIIIFVKLEKQSFVYIAR